MISSRWETADLLSTLDIVAFNLGKRISNELRHNREYLGRINRQTFTIESSIPHSI